MHHLMIRFETKGHHITKSIFTEVTMTNIQSQYLYKFFRQGL